MPFTIGLLEIFKYVVPGSVWLAILFLGPWELPDEIVDAVETGDLVIALGLVLASYIIGTISTHLSFRALVSCTSRRFNLVRPEGSFWPRLEISGIVKWPFEDQPRPYAEWLERIDPTEDHMLVSFYSQFRERDPERAKDGERLVNFCKVGLESYSPGLAGEAKIREAEINIPCGLFLPMFVAALIAILTLVIDGYNGSFSPWVLVVFIAGMGYLCFAMSLFNMLREEEVRFVYRAFFLCAPRSDDGSYTPGTKR